MSQIAVYCAVIGSAWGFGRFIVDMVGAVIWAYQKRIVNGRP